MKIIGRLANSLSSLETVGGSLAAVDLQNVVVLETEHNQVGIFAAVPVINDDGGVGIDFQPRVMALNLDLLQRWIGTQYRIVKIVAAGPIKDDENVGSN